MSKSSNAALKLEMNPIEEIAKIAHRLTGVQFTSKHSTMIQSRLEKRLKSLGLTDLSQYVELLHGEDRVERDFLVSTLTTHHTYFFREITHFEVLTKKTLPYLLPLIQKRQDKTLRIWSAACSRGQEVYSLAMWIQPYLKAHAPDVELKIVGSDIDPESVKFAANGVFPWREIKEIPMQFLSSNWARGTGEISEYAKAKSHLRKVTQFHVQNLMLPSPKPTTNYDIIFCRNVFIYFDQSQIKAITNQFLQSLNPEGFLFLGISESLHGLGLPLKTVEPSVYVGQEHSLVKPAEKPTGPALKNEKSLSSAAPEAPVRVLVVDDSSSVHTLMKAIFTKDSGFQIVGHAMNGIEAQKMVREHKPDAMTLDIHMPEMNGVDYLRTNWNANHPPVIMVSSVSREDSSLAAKALTYGASDYVEKPAVTNLRERADEIRTKIRCALQSKALKVGSGDDLKLDRSFETKLKIEAPEKCLRVLTVQGSDRNRLQDFFRAASAEGQPPTLVLLDAEADTADLLKNEIENKLGIRFQNPDQGALKVDHTYFLSRGPQTRGQISNWMRDKVVSIIVFGETSLAMTSVLRDLPVKSARATQFLLEDIGERNGKHALKDICTDHSPQTGFAYLSDQFLCQKLKSKP